MLGGLSWVGDLCLSGHCTLLPPPTLSVSPHPDFTRAVVPAAIVAGTWMTQTVAEAVA